jgi:DNA-binding NtrC family response regulator
VQGFLVRTRKGRAIHKNSLSSGVVIVVGEAPDWRPELQALLRAEGFASCHVAALEAILPVLARRTVHALFLAAGPRPASDLLLLQRIHEISPRTAVVAVTTTPSDPDLKRAFESGATAFLSWPATNDTVRHVIDRGAVLAFAASRP